MGYSKRIKTLLLDTSALLLLYERVRVFEDAEEALASKPGCIVPRQVVEELEKLARSPGLHRQRAARLALRVVAEKCRVVEVAGVDTADDALLKLALELDDAIVVTADNELRRRLRELGLPNVFYRRSRHGMEVEGL